MKQKVLIGAAVAVAAVIFVVVASPGGTKPLPSPSPSASVSGKPTASPTASMNPSPSRTPVKTPTATPSPSPTPPPSPTPTGPGDLSWEKAAYSVDEDEGPVVITVIRTGNTSVTTMANYQTAGGSAGPDDYTAPHGTLTFAPGETRHTITVAITDDQIAEGDETILFVVDNQAGDQYGTSATTITIVDDESNY